MRVLFWFLILAVAAVAVALAARLTTGYALFVAPPYRVELSLNLLLLLVLGGFFAGYASLRIVRRAMRLPLEVRQYRQRQQLERARAKQDAAIVALLEGRFGRARQFAEEALAIPQSSGLSALLAARAAIATREFAVAESLL
jgi:HemY protein